MAFLAPAAGAAGGGTAAGAGGAASGGAGLLGEGFSGLGGSLTTGFEAGAGAGAGASLGGGGGASLSSILAKIQEMGKQGTLPSYKSESTPAPPAPSIGGTPPPPSTFKGFGAWKGGEEKRGGSLELIEALLSLLQRRE